MCWDKDRVFESSRASAIVDRLLHFYIKVQADTQSYWEQRYRQAMDKQGAESVKLPSREQVDVWLMRKDYMDPDAAEMYISDFYEYLSKYMEKK